jgi:hypothetical protein
MNHQQPPYLLSVWWDSYVRHLRSNPLRIIGSRGVFLRDDTVPVSTCHSTILAFTMLLLYQLYSCHQNMVIYIGSVNIL